MTANLRMGRLRHVRWPHASQVVAWCCFLIIAVDRQVLIAVAADPEIDRRASALIDQLVARDWTVAAQRGCDLQGGRDGHPTDFLPLADAATVTTGDVFPKADAVLALIRLGADVVPALVAHLDDKRATPIGPYSVRRFHGRSEWNTKSKSDIPLREETSVAGPEAPSTARDDYHLTVGDLCYEVLGQIVNRDYDCVTWSWMNCDIASPGQSSTMRAHLKRTWGTLSRERHCQSLVSDFQLPDSVSRRRGAYHRLAFYYPDTAERVVLEELQKPYYRKEDVDTFCWGSLVIEPDPARRRQLVTDFVSSRNEAYDYGLQRALRDEARYFDLRQARGQESAALIAGDILCEIYLTTAENGDDDVPPYPFPTRAEQADFIRQLTRDQSRLVGDRVNQILETAAEDDGELIPACLNCLANRGYGDVLIRCLERVAPRALVTNYFDVAVVTACATSHDPPVRERLRRFALATDNGTFFVKALDAFDRTDGPAVIAQGRLLLSALRKDEADREGVLSAIVARYPDESLPLTAEYLKDRAIDRIWSVCEDLTRPTDRRFLLLEPYLDDRGEYIKGRTVAGMVAYRMAKTMPDLEHAVDGLEEPGREVIEKVKQHCRSLRTAALDDAAIDVPLADE